MLPTSPPFPDFPYRFTPVPRRSDRADGWSSDRQHAFVWALARMPSVSAAARSVGMSARSAYRLRQADGAEHFARAWDDAMHVGMEAISDTVIDRAVNGQEFPILYRGQVVGKVHRYDNRLAMRLLQWSNRQFPNRRDRS